MRRSPEGPQSARGRNRLTVMPASDYLRRSISNGSRYEQALIRRWWHETHEARGRMVWEYYLEGCYVDAVWFPDAVGVGVEIAGRNASRLFPLRDSPVVLCEAKRRLTPELVGQALVYDVFARRAGGQVRSVVIFAEAGSPSMKSAAEKLWLEVVLNPV